MVKKTTSAVKNTNLANILLMNSFREILILLIKKNNRIKYWTKIKTPPILIESKKAVNKASKIISIIFIFFSLVIYESNILKLKYVQITHTDKKGMS